MNMGTNGSVLLLLGMHFVWFTLGQSMNAEMGALLDFRRSLVPPMNSSVDPLAGWLATDATPCNWTGVSCNDFNDVTSLTLPDLSLSGSISPRLGALQYLQALVLSNNNLVGAIPPEFGNLRALRTLDLSGNLGLSGPLPLELFNLTNLEQLRLMNNNFSGCIPVQILQLVHLSDLNLAMNALTGNVPRVLGALGNTLTSIGLGTNFFHGDIPRELANLTMLRTLDLSNNLLTGSIPKELGHLSALEILNLDGCLLQGAIPEELAMCTNLVVLTLGGSSATELGNAMSLWGPIPNSLGDLTQLEIFQVMYTQVNGSIPDALGNCTKLQVVNLMHNLLEGPIPANFGNLMHIISFDVSYNMLNGVIPSWIGAWANLTTLILYNNYFVGEIPHELGQCRMLTNLEFGRNNLTGPIPFDICINTTIQYMLLNGNNLVGNVSDDFRHCKSLISLDLSYNQLSGAIPSYINELVTLNYLDLSHNNFTGQLPEGLWQIPSLMTISVADNDLIGNLSTSIGNLSQLISLNLDYNSFGGPIPLEIGTLLVLTTLSIQSNNLVGPIPPQLGNCRMLSSLNLASNGLTGSIPPELGNLTNIVSMVLANNNLFGRIPNELSAGFQIPSGWEEFHRQVYVLDFSYNRLTGNIPSSIGDCVGLWQINMAGNDLSGNIPTELGRLVHLSTLDLSSNSLIGSIPPQLGNCIDLQGLNLAHNELHGQIPPQLGLIPNLVELNVSRNQLAGDIPTTFGKLERLLHLDLSGNSLSGELHQDLSGMVVLVGLYLQGNALSGTLDNLLSNGLSWQQIEVLDLSHNVLSGSIPENLVELVSLKVLNLGYNNFTGDLGDLKFGTFGQLVFLDLSNNHFEGVFPSHICDLSALIALNVSDNDLIGRVPVYGSCGKFNSTSFLNNEGLCGQHLVKDCSTPTRGDMLKASVIVWIAIGVTFLMCLIVFTILGCRKRTNQQKRKQALDLNYGEKDGLIWMGLKPKSFSNVSKSGEPLSINLAMFAQPLQKLTLSDIFQATNGFFEGNVIGEGGFGRVYKANFPNGSEVAIKKLGCTAMQGDREFFAEMETLGKVKHTNLVPLMGYCSFGEEKLLMYEYMPNGSLDSWLRNQPVLLDWPKRHRIILGTAKGLCFLHHMFVPHIIHRDMKASNILLDANFNPRLSDFGLARLISAYDTHVSTDVAGTFGYIPPEYGQTWRSTTRGDVYSFGVVVLELVTGKEPTGNAEIEGGNLVDLVRSVVKEGDPTKLLDPVIVKKNDYNKPILNALHIAVLCTSEDPKRRPTMLHVVKLLRNLDDSTLLVH